MEVNIVIAGQAGQGIQKISHVLAKAFIRSGYYVFNYRDYQSRIKGGHNYNSLKVSDKPVYSHEEEEIDYLLALDQNSVNKHYKKLSKTGYIIADKSIKADRKIEVDIGYILKEANAPKISENVVVISVLWKVLNLDKNILKSVIKEELGENNAKIVDIVWEKVQVPLQEIRDKLKETKKKYYLTGSEGIAYGAIAAGLDIYIAYPMTPASPVLHILAKLKDKYDILVYQPDNEIGVINMAVGASYAGAKVMVGTSGGGFALMTEALALAGISEIPIVVYLAQRYAPATGMPTYTMQGDLKFALNAGHGEFPRIVVAPGDPAECFKRTIEAFYLAYKYNIPTIILSDTFLAESACTFDEIEFPNIKPERFIDLDPKSDYKFYELTETGVSKRTIPGIKDIVVKANSYEHDEYGFTTEDPEIGKKMNEKRWKKVKYIKEELKKFKPYKIYGNGKKLLVGWGSVKMPVLEAIKKLKDWSYLHISYISPFLEEIGNILKNYEKVVLIENNVTGLLGKVIREETGIKIEEKILKYDGRPFTSKYIINKIKKLDI